MPPGDGKVAPGDGKVAPGDGKVAPGDGKVPPGDGKVPPGDGKVPPGDVIEILDDEISSPEIGEFPSSPLQSPLSPSSSELVVPGGCTIYPHSQALPFRGAVQSIHLKGKAWE